MATKTCYCKILRGMSSCSGDFKCKSCFRCLSWQGYEEGTVVCGREECNIVKIHLPTEFLAEIWEQIKEYAGIYHISTNLIHFDKLTYEELVYNDEIFSKYLDVSYWDIHGHFWQFCDINGKWYREGEVNPIPEKILYDDFVRAIKEEYSSPYKYCGEDLAGFWTEISTIIANHLKVEEGKKAVKKKKREAVKAFNETAKGMTSQLYKIEDEERKLVDRMKKDADKLKNLKAKREKLEAKRRVKRAENIKERYGS